MSFWFFGLCLFSLRRFFFSFFSSRNCFIVDIKQSLQFICKIFCIALNLASMPWLIKFIDKLINDLSKKNPEKLAELQALFMKEAERNQVLPIDDRTVERVNASIAGRPDLMGKRTSLTLAEGMTGMTENVFLNIKNKSKTVTAVVDVPDDGGNGTIIAQGGRFGGWSLYVKDGMPGYHYNFLGLQRFTVVSTEKLKPGNSIIKFDFAYDGGGLAKGGMGTLYINDKKVGEGRIERTQPMIFSADETADVGIDLATPVVESIGAERVSKFTGRIPKVTIEVH